MSAGIGQTFEKEVVSWRVWTSFLRSTVIQFLVVFAFSLAVTFSPWRPVSWISESLHRLIHPSNWISDVFMILSFYLLSNIYLKNVLVHSHVFSGKKALLLKLFNSQVLLSLLGHVFAGAILAWCYLTMFDGDGATVRYLGRRYLNTVHVFLVISGMCSGFCLWWDFHFTDANVLNFPVVQQPGNEIIRGEIKPLLSESITKVLLNLRWFYPLYLVLGSNFEYLASLFLYANLHPDDADPSWARMIWKHGNVSTVFKCFIINILVTFNVGLLRVIHNIGLTRRVKFHTVNVAMTSTSSAMEDVSTVPLPEAIGAKGNELMRYLALYDFSVMAENSSHRRSDFYSLSQPGGHARTWDELISKCLVIIDNLSKELNESGKVEKLPVKEQPVEGKSVVQKLKILGQEKMKVFFGEVPDANVRSVYARSMPVIWTVKGLSHLVTNSIAEDRFGVVQKDLARIIVAFLKLLQTLETYKGFTATARKNRFETRDLQLKQDLRVTLKTALYRITVGFGDNLQSVEIPSEYQARLSNYRCFREG